uniref:Uncharacterized protein n=1 Tax=Anguilla anguilla TaxID=7936 RepID=A0A0E9VL41_ANGAN
MYVSQSKQNRLYIEYMVQHWYSRVCKNAHRVHHFSIKHIFPFSRPILGFIQL